MYLRKKLIIFFIASLFSLNSSFAAHDSDCEAANNYDRSGFDDWKSKIVDQSDSNNLDSAFVQKIITPYELNINVIKNDKCQPEFTLTFSEYIEKRISDLRISNGRKKMSQFNSLLDDISSHYGVQKRFIVSIWGLETSYGNYTGGYPVIESLLTLSYDQRRREFFTKQLFKALKILNDKHIDLDNFKGSWAGAMGQNQFMPSSFLAYAQDFDNDGKKNIWTNEADALASIARYLKGIGSNKWDNDFTWGREVLPPKNISSIYNELFIERTKGCVAIRKLSKKLPLSEFARMNFTQLNGDSLPNANINSYLLRMGREESQYRYFIVYPNYLNILSYNCSNYYGLSVGLLSDQLK